MAEYGPVNTKEFDKSKAFPEKKPSYSQYTENVVTPTKVQDNILQNSLDDTIRSSGTATPPTDQQQRNIFRARVTQASNAGLSNEEIANRIAGGLPAKQQPTQPTQAAVTQQQPTTTETKKLVTGPDGKKTAVTVPSEATQAPTEGSQAYFDQIQQQETAKQQKEYQTNIDRGIQEYQRAQEDNMLLKESKIQQLDSLRLNAKTDLQRIIEDITTKAQQASDQSQLFAAMGGYGNTTNFVKGLDNISQEAGKAIDRAKRDYSMYNISLLDQENNILGDFNRNTKRLSEDFNYDFRDLVSETKLQLADFRNRLSPEKYGLKLSEISLDVAQKVANLRTTYISNLQSEVGTMRDAYDLQYKQASDFRAQQDTYVNDFVSNGLNRSYDEILSAIQSGDLTPEQGDRALSGMVNSTVGRLEQQIGGDAAQFYDDVENRILDGEKPGEILSSIVGSPEYKKLNQGETKYINVGGGAILKTNPDGTESWITVPGTTKVGSSPIVKNVSTTDASTVASTLSTFVSNYSTPTEYGQCGEFVNDYLREMGVSNNGANIFTDPIDVKKQYANTQTPTVGSIAIMDSRFAPEYGHVAIVTRVNNDGTINVLESNKDGKEMTSTGVYNVNDMFGFFDPTLRAIEPPTASELAMYEKGAQYIDKKGGISQERYNEIADYQKRTVKDFSYDPYYQAFNLLSFDKPTLADQEAEKIRTLIESGDTNRVKTKLETLASNNIDGAAEKSNFQATKTLVSSLSSVEDILTELHNKGVKTGILKGKYENLAGAFGELNDPEVRKLGTLLKDQLDAIRRARSGAALTEFEEKFYDSIFPSAGKGYALNMATIKGLKDSRELLKESYLKNAYGESLYDIIWGGGDANALKPDTSRFDEYDSAIQQKRGTDDKGLQVDFYY